MDGARRQLREGLVINGHYQIGTLLGIGEMGDVYACRDLDGGQSKVVIKTLCSIEIPHGTVSSLSREFSLLRRLRHPNLARVFDFGVVEDSGEPFIVQEHIEAKELFAATEHAGIEKVLRLIMALAAVLRYLHLRGIVHGNLKPSNAVLSENENERLVLLDFGLKRQPWNMRQYIDHASLAYAAPEVLLGQSAGIASDMYALGILIYQLLARRLPFEDEDVDFLVQKQLQGNIDMRPVERLHGGDAMSQLLSRLLEKDPGKRLISEDAVIRAAGDAISGDFRETALGCSEGRFSAAQFVNREREMQLLFERARHVWEKGRGWTVFITGEAGSGKTRCMEELRSWALLENWRVIEADCGVCDEAAYGPYRQILATADPTSGEAIFCFDKPLRAGESTVAETFSAFAAGQFRDLLTRELTRRLAVWPTMLFLHDFHRADEATSTVLDYLSSDIQAHPVLLCVSFRSGEDAKEVLGRVMNLTVSQGRGEILALEPLEEDSIRQLIAGMTGDQELKESLGNWIFRNVGGNPFFLEEMLKHLVEQGVLSPNADRWRFAGKDLRELEVPAGVGAVLLRRLSQLSPPARKLADWLALLRHAVPRAFLNSVMSNNAGYIAEALKELAQKQMVRIDAHGAEETVAFNHALVAEVIRGQLPNDLRRKMHRRIADAIEHEYGTAGHLHELTMHHIEAKSSVASVRYALASAAQFRAEFAHENALRCYEHALKNRNGLTCEELCFAAIEASDTMFALGLAKQAVHILKTEMRRGKSIGADLKARLYMQLALAYQHLGNLPLQEACCARGLQLFKNRTKTKPRLTEAMLWAELAFGAVVQSRPQRGLAYLDKALQACPDKNAVALAGRIQNLSASLHRIACNLREALSSSKRATEILDHSGESYLACSGYSTLGVILMGLGRFSCALEKHRRAVSLSDESRSVILKSQALGNLAECLCRRGLIQEALNTAERASNSVYESNNPVLIHAFNSILAEVKLAAGDYRGVFQIVDELDKDGWHLPALFTVGHARYVAASLNFFLGNFSKALKHIEQLAKSQTSEAPFYEYEIAEALKARILFERGFAQKAFSILRSLDKAVAKKHWPYQMCIIKLHICEILLKRGSLAAAGKYARNAFKLATAMQCIPLLSYSHLLLGLIYSSLRPPDDPVDRCNGGTPAVDAKLYADKAIEELQRCCQLNESVCYADSAWRAHAELCRIYKFLGNADISFAHANRAYELLCKLEEQIPSEKLSAFYGAFDRSRAKLELVHLIEAGRERAHNKEISAVPMHDDENARILLRVSNAVNSIRELNPLLEAILDQLIPAIGMERALVFLKDESTGRLALAMGRNKRRESLSDAEAAQLKISESVLKEGKPIISADVRNDLRVTDRGANPATIGKLFCAPLKVSGRAVGVIYADHPLPSGGFGESVINLFAAFCNFATVAIDNALVHRHFGEEKSIEDRCPGNEREGYAEIVGKSEPMEALRDMISRAAASPLDILVTGESGTGKELVARAIHRTGRRRSGKLITVDCGSLSASLAESELFGYRKGAFTGAAENRPGLLEAASGGIIFLDEISNLPFRLQPKLLRVLQEREVRRIGETEPRKIDIQVIAASNKDLLEETRMGRFREDLIYRLKAMEIRVPPLRERPEDISLLCEWFLKKTAELEDGRSKILMPEALKLLKSYSYPGNVRELKNIITGSYYTTVGAVIGPDNLPPEVRREDATETDSDFGFAAGRLYRELLEGKGNFDSVVKEPFLQHQFGSTRVRGVLQRALKDTGGSYRDALTRLGVPDAGYAATMQFLKRHKCYLDYRPFRRKRPKSGSQ